MNVLHDPTLHHGSVEDDDLLIARLAAGDVDAAERDRADRLARDCPGCAELLADLRAIAAAARDLPVPTRPRDFRLTASDAERLRPIPARSIRQRLADAFLGRGTAGRPLATALVTLGLAGLLVASLPGIFPQSASILSSVGNSFSGATGARPGAIAAPSAGTAIPPDNGETGRFAAGPSAAASALPAASPPPAVPSAAPSAGSGFSALTPSGSPSEAAATGQPPTKTSGQPAGPAAPTSPSSPAPPAQGIFLGILAAGLLLFAARRLAGGAPGR